MHHVILGAGPAGVTAAETIRKHAPDDQITLISGEPHPAPQRLSQVAAAADLGPLLSRLPDGWETELAVFADIGIGIGHPNGDGRGADSDRRGRGCVQR